MKSMFRSKISLALMLAIAIVMSFGTAAFAAAPAPSQTATATVTGDPVTYTDTLEYVDFTQSFMYSDYVHTGVYQTTYYYDSNGRIIGSSRMERIDVYDVYQNNRIEHWRRDYSDGSWYTWTNSYPSGTNRVFKYSYWTQA